MRVRPRHASRAGAGCRPLALFAVAAAAGIFFGVSLTPPAFAASGQPPERPPAATPPPPEAEAAGEEAETGQEVEEEAQEETRPGATPPPEEGEEGQEGPAAPDDQPTEGEPPAEGAEGEGGEEGANEDAETDPDAPGRRAPEVAAAPVGILPGEMLAAPAPAPGSPVIEMLFGDEGFVLHTASGEVMAYWPRGETPRWGLPDARATFIAEAEGTLVLLDEDGEVTLRNMSDGRRTGGFPTGLAPDREEVAGAAPARTPAALAGGTLYWVSGGVLHGYRIATGAPVLEAPLPPGEPARIAVALPPEEAETDRTADGWPLLLVSLGSGGVAAVSAAPEAAGDPLRWQAESEGPVTGPALPLPEEERVIFGDEGGDLSAVDLLTGERRWRWRLSEGFHDPPLASRGRLYAATKANSLYNLDAKRGGQRWRAALPGRPAAPPLRLAGAVLIVTRDGLLVEMNAETGARIGRPRDLEAEVVGVVRWAGDGAREEGWRDRRLFVGLRDGRLAILGPRTGRGNEEEREEQGEEREPPPPGPA